MLDHINKASKTNVDRNHINETKSIMFEKATEVRHTI